MRRRPNRLRPGQSRRRHQRVVEALDPPVGILIGTHQDERDGGGVFTGQRPLGACSWPWAWTRITLSVKARACRSEYVTVLPV
jgi:hypothetical protein